ncbi:MAG: hypothetical protein QOF22_1976 [Bradyrhizobium sp.]|nr:hypothetical protein [Bradyrhizobium sp.]
MNDNPTLQDLLEVQRHFGLPSPALVEKDWYVVKALAAIGGADTTPFRLVFGGGTALARAHKLIRRMSEDIDLKIVADSTLPRSALRRLRDTITDALLSATPGMAVTIRSTGCPMPLLLRARVSSDQRFRSRRRSGRCVAPPFSGR